MATKYEIITPRNEVYGTYATREEAEKSRREGDMVREAK